jgi:hypothetical protein
MSLAQLIGTAIPFSSSGQVGLARGVRERWVA